MKGINKGLRLYHYRLTGQSDPTAALRGIIQKMIIGNPNEISGRGDFFILNYHDGNTWFESKTQNVGSDQVIPPLNFNNRFFQKTMYDA